MNIVVFDLDGTLSIVGDRIKYLQQKEKNWDKFYESCGEDKVNKPIARIFRKFLFDGANVKIVTGRRESVRNKTMIWLSENDMDITPEELIMRQDGDKRHDIEVKPELVKNFIGDIQMIFEDRNSMVKKWRELGLVCLQVAEGDF